LCEQRGTGTERSKNLREQSGERESKKSSTAERSGRSRSARGAVSEDHRNHEKWERGAAKQPAPLRSNALHWSNGVSAEKIASYIFVLIVYSHKVQSDSTTIKQFI